ncbi:hypothetical protein ABGD95_005043 [Escherichia coli]|nr:hypothetical protein [Escherichia coli]
MKSSWLAMSPSVKCDRYTFSGFVGAGTGKIFIQPDGTGDALFVVRLSGKVVTPQCQILLKGIAADAFDPRGQFFNSISSFGE